MARLLTDLDLADYRPDEVGGDTFIENLPPDPDTALAVYSKAGPPADARLGYDEPGIQIVARSADPRVAAASLAAIYDQLHGLVNTELPDGTWLVSCLGQASSPTPLGRDQNGRHEFSLTFACEVRSLTAHRE